MNRGDVVIVDFSPTSPSTGIRPAVVVQNDRDNARMRNTIVAQVTSNVRRAQEDTQLLIDQYHADWQQSGLRLSSVVNCSNLASVLSTTSPDPFVCPVQQYLSGRPVRSLVPTTDSS